MEPVTISCPNCGATNPRDTALCARCSFALPARPPAAPALPTGSAADQALSGLIPYNNSAALIAYYLAVFSVIPLFGFFMAVAALILGIRGLRFAREHPEAKGKAHALIGIIVGGLIGLVHLTLTVLFLVTLSSRSS